MIDTAEVRERLERADAEGKTLIPVTAQWLRQALAELEKRRPAS